MEATVTNRLPLIALLSANAISLIGNQLTYLAIPWLVLQTTNSAAQRGIAAFFATAPASLVAILGGPLIDRWGYKRTSVIADVASGITVALIPLLAQMVGSALWPILALSFLGALLDIPGGLARESLLPPLAQRAGFRLERVNAANQALWRTSGILGPPVAGLLIVWLGPALVLAFDALSFAFAAALVAWAVPSAQPPAPSDNATSYIADLREGVAYLRRDRLLLGIIASFTLINALGEPLFRVILPVIARDYLGGARDLGFLLALFAGSGLAATLAYGAIGERLPRRPSTSAHWGSGASPTSSASARRRGRQSPSPSRSSARPVRRSP